VISFLVIGQFWISHNRLFELVRRYDQRLLWLNLVVLLTVTFMPFLRAGLLFWVLLIPVARLLLARRHHARERARQSRATRSR
jgi:Endosomal/lysosomal potassium channel TMEM175